jgi:hypothetical protein
MGAPRAAHLEKRQVRGFFLGGARCAAWPVLKAPPKKKRRKKELAG